MKILLVNDDGVLAIGLQTLFTRVSEVAECTVIAPDRDKSGSSSSLTLDAPLRLTKQANGFISVNGTPTDCVHLALNGYLKERPDMVISGINLGANLGDDVIYSGTIGAAMEGRFLSYPAIAVSICSSRPKYLETAAYVVKRVLSRINDLNLPERTILNINVPDLPLHELKGYSLTCQGNRNSPKPIEAMRDPRGHSIYWISTLADGKDKSPGTDFYAVEQGYVSMTPIQIDQTYQPVFPDLKLWLGGFSDV